MGKRIKDLSRAETDGYLAVDNALNGTGKMNTSVIFNNFAKKFVPNETEAKAGRTYLYQGVLYLAKQNYTGDWDATKFDSISLDKYLMQLQENAGFASITASSKGLKVLSMVKKIAFYDPQNLNADFRLYLITLVNNGQTLQITLEKDGTYYDFKADENSQSGIKKYSMLQSENKPLNGILSLEFNWDNYESVLGGTDLYVRSTSYGYDVLGGYGNSLQNILNSVLVPRKNVEKSGLLSMVYFKSDVSGTAEILVGEVDENLHFIVRTRKNLAVEQGNNYLSVSALNVYVKQGEYVGIKTAGKRYVSIETGAADSDRAFYYGSESQLEAYSVEGQYATFAFKYVVNDSYQEQINSIEKNYTTSDAVDKKIEADNINSLCAAVGFSRAYTTAKGAKVLSFIKKIDFCDYENAGAEYKFYLVTTVSSGAVFQITLEKDGTYYDFKVNAPDKTGVKNYVLQNNKKVLRCTIDWDAYESVLSISDLYVTSKAFNELPVGNTSTSTSSQEIKSILVPCQAIKEDCKITSIYNRSGSAGKIKICVGDIDQLMRFNVYSETEVEVAAGDNFLDVSGLEIYAKKGNYVGVLVVDLRYFYTEDGLPADENSFYYSTSASNIYQLIEYDVSDKRIVFMFGFTYNTSTESQLGEKINELQRENTDFESQLDIISGNIGFAYDAAGNKYKTRVVDNFVKAFALNFKHLLVVGNSYTVHPTTADTGVLATNRWWGHWSMAASKKESAWTTLLENNLKARDVSSTVQAVFGRTYEMNGGIDSNDAFVYWDENNTLQSLYQNVSNFSNTDCVIFFLGDNYNGDAWYDRYKEMVEKFETLFPNALIFCMSARSRSSVNPAILQVATEKDLTYINVYGKAPSSRIGSYVAGDDGNLHQIADSAVANHPGDFGQKDFVEVVSEAIGVDNTAEFYNVVLNNDNLEIEHTQRQAGAIVSVFGSNLVTSISVTSGSGSVEVTSHLATDYGNVFTFIMPADDVEIN